MADPEGREPRSYLIGLPVVVTVNPDGSVHYWIDTAEASTAVVDLWYEDEQYEDVPWQDIEDDAAAIDADHETRRRESK